jgi:hypothetical protein
VHDEHCGHDHDHDGHSHDHDHAHIHEDAIGVPRVELTEHEGALIASGVLRIYTTDLDAVRSALSEQMTAAAQQVEQAGGIIGHIKATLSSTNTEMLSITDVSQPIQDKTTEMLEASINLVLIVFAIDKDLLIAWTQEALDVLAGRTAT